MEQVKVTEATFTRLQEVLEGFTVQVQDSYPVTVSTGQCRKQTRNKDRKKAANVKHFSVNECYVYK